MKDTYRDNDFDWYYGGADSRGNNFSTSFDELFDMDYFDRGGKDGPGTYPSQPPRKGGTAWAGVTMMSKLYHHYQFGGGRDYFIDASKFDFSHTSRKELGIPANPVINKSYSVNLFKAGINALSLSFGNVKMIYHGNDQFSIMSDRFDFDRQPNASFSRNAATLVGSLVFGQIFETSLLLPYSQPNVFWGGPFDIYFWGLITIK
jgi:hypothetical protein